MRTSGRAAAVVGGAWALAALLALAWLWGTPHRSVHQSPDEASTARAVHLVGERLRPAEVLPFDDPADLARQRMWVTVEGETTAASPPGTFLAYGLPRLVRGGAWLVFLVPALGVGALAAAATLLAGPWLGATLPGLAFPAVYWLVRPWHNVSLELALAAFAALALAVHRHRPHPAWPWVALTSATAAAVVRPDHVHLLLGLSLIWTVALDDRPRALRRWLVAHAAAAAAFLLATLGLNLWTTGAALTTTVDLLDFPAEVAPVGRDLPFPLSQIVLIVAPRGWPDWANVAVQLRKYWVVMGPVLPVVAGAIAVLGWLAARRRDDRLGRAGLVSLALLVVFAITRVSATDLGAPLPHPGLVHSFPRYTALVFVGFALAAVALAARLPTTPLRLAASTLATLVAAGGVAYALLVPGAEQEGLAWLRGHLRAADAYAAAVVAHVPPDAVVYSAKLDKYLWAYRPTGMLQRERVPEGAPEVDAEGLARSARAALAAGYSPVLLELWEHQSRDLDVALAPDLTLQELPAVLPPLEGIPQLPIWLVVPR